MIRVTGYKVHGSRHGFTILESLAVISIVAVVAVGALMTLRGTRSRTALKEAGATLTAALEEARNKAANGTGTDSQGVHISTDRIFAFEGPVFDPSDSTEHLLPPGVSTDQTNTTILFSRLTGLPNATATIILTGGSGETAGIILQESGAAAVWQP